MNLLFPGDRGWIFPGRYFRAKPYLEIFRELPIILPFAFLADNVTRMKRL